ncbi:MAG: peptidoglycan DD-metalloendopeptidase family protein [Candidatus Roizmanbacteria bacterium]|nr:peptidoglycan DD-metalloendopeptidase family protein [Candidatus Roizmanbacteria bacterium]
MFKTASTWQEIKDFYVFLKTYLQTKAVALGRGFEQFKNILVLLLMTKRGKYQHSFLHASFLLLIVSIWIAGPIITENNPLIGKNALEGPAQNRSIASIYTYASSSNLTTTHISQKPRDIVEAYKVKSGDTLAEIAKSFGLEVDTIKWANDLTTDTITPGDTLKIPPVNGIVYKVKSGDTIYSIAEKFNTNAQKIVNFPFNEFADIDTFAITTGQTLIVPDGVPPSEAPRRPAQFAPQFAAGQAGSGNFIWPTSGVITQYYVWYHQALDIANPSSPSVIAADTGTVSYAGCINWGYGCHIIIDHANGYQTLYGHLSRIDVSTGQGVAKSQQIGFMGSTGLSTGTHLHFEIRSGGQLLNPLDFLQ